MHTWKEYYLGYAYVVRAGACHANISALERDIHLELTGLVRNMFIGFIGGIWRYPFKIWGSQ